MTNEQATRRYFSVVFPGGVAFLGLCYGLKLAEDSAMFPAAVLYAAALVPIAVLLGLFWAHWRYMNEIDEFLRSIQVRGGVRCHRGRDDHCHRLGISGAFRRGAARSRSSASIRSSGSPIRLPLLSSACGPVACPEEQRSENCAASAAGRRRFWPTSLRSRGNRSTPSRPDATIRLSRSPSGSPGSSGCRSKQSSRTRGSSRLSAFRSPRTGYRRRALHSARTMPAAISAPATRWKPSSSLAEDQHRADGAEERDQVDEEARAVGADQLDAADIEDLRDQRGEEDRVERRSPSRAA